MNTLQPIFLGVNIDHIATVRNARGTQYPDPVQAAFVAEQAGADGITIHLREDRRHITDRDVRILRETIQTRMNLEMAVTDEMLKIACDTKPEFVCLVPERREEVTTEGGLDIINNESKIRSAIEQLSENGILVSLFIDPDEKQIEAAARVNAPFIELHTGNYADADNYHIKAEELNKIKLAVQLAKKLKINVNAGHGLHYQNVQEIARIPEIYELNIGHAIIGRSLFVGLAQAVQEMKSEMNRVRNLGKL